jgi:hypothetical protein
MDPNTALENLRVALHSYRAAEDQDTTAAAAAASEIADAAEALDDWLSKGGFMPQAWTRHTAEAS